MLKCFPPISLKSCLTCLYYPRWCDRRERMNSLTSFASFPVQWERRAALVLDELRGLESELLLSRGCQVKGIDSLVLGQLMWWATHGSRPGAPLLSPLPPSARVSDIKSGWSGVPQLSSLLCNLTWVSSFTLMVWACVQSLWAMYPIWASLI